MDIIQMAKDMGKAIQADERYIALMSAKKANDEDQELQELIGKFNLVRLDLNNEVSKEDKDQKKLEELNEELQKVYQQVMSNPNMTAFNTAKVEMDTLLNQVNQVLSLCVNGQDPETIDLDAQCSGSCSSCSGCH